MLGLDLSYSMVVKSTSGRIFRMGSQHATNHIHLSTPCTCIGSLWNLASVLAKLPPRRLPNVRAMPRPLFSTSRLWDLARSYNKTFYRFVKWAPQIYPHGLQMYANIITTNKSTSKPWTYTFDQIVIWQSSPSFPIRFPGRVSLRGCRVVRSLRNLTGVSSVLLPKWIAIR